MSDLESSSASWHRLQGGIGVSHRGASESYGDRDREGRALLEDVAVVDLSHRDRIEVTGRDRIRLLHAMISNDVKGLMAGQGCLATFCSELGRVITDLRLLVLPDRVWLELEPGMGGEFVAAIDRFIIADKCYFAPLEETVGQVGVLGPEALALVARVWEGEVPPLAPYGHVEGSIGGIPVRLARILSVHEEDRVIFVPSEHLLTVLDALVNAGGPLAGGAALESARVVAGVPRMGADITSDTIPIEAGLRDRAISWNKGCYRGQEVICRLDTLGEPVRRLVRLTLLSGDCPSPGVELASPEGKKAGMITSVSRTPGGEMVALGYVKRKMNAPGMEVTFTAPEGNGRLHIDRWIQL